MKEDLKRIRILFLTAFSVSLTANSGYAILSVMKNRFVSRYQWIKEEEMNDLIALAQSAPGPIGINASLIIGYRCAGPLGAAAAVLGCGLPPFLIMIPVTYFYQSIVASQIVRIFMKGMQLGVVAMLADVLLGLWKGVIQEKSLYPYAVILLSFLYIRFTDLPFFYLLLLCLLSGIIRVCLLLRKAGEHDAA